MSAHARPQARRPGLRVVVGAAGRGDARPRAARRPADDHRPRRRPAGRADRRSSDDPEALGTRPTRRRRVLGRRAGSSPTTPARSGCSGPTGRRGARQEFTARSRGRRGRRRARRPRRRRRLAGVRARRRAAPRRAARRARRSSCRRRWPSRGSTSASTRPPRSPTRSARASTSRSSTCAGRQCSDFLAFHAHKLERGRRARAGPAGHAHADGHRVPDGRPALEVLRRRHGPAVPGRAGHGRAPRLVRARLHGALLRGPRLPRPRQLHGELQPPARRRTAIAPKKGWAALNFFYNTSFDPDLVLLSDEPWSRPGDFVLLRALSDLVCASSACPDDIDPANGWEVTDVHVRVYSPENRFSMAIAHRVTPEAEPVLTKETAFHSALVGADPQRDRVPRLLAADLLHQRGRGRRVLGLPREGRRDGPLAAAQVGDPRARTPSALMQHAVTRDIRRLADGQVVYTAMCNETGGMVDDATVFRLGARQLPLRRRRRVRRRAPQAARRAARPARVDQADDRRAAQPRRPGAAQPRHPARRSSGRRPPSRSSRSCAGSAS